MSSDMRTSGENELIATVSRHLPVELAYYDERYLHRRIKARMRRTDAATTEAYLGLIREDAAEREALVDSLSINVTGFFRNPGAWESLRSILRELTAEQRRVNVWSAPCADGREPYSVAMLAADDPETAEERIRIIGSDVSDAAIETARSGEYRTSATNDIAEELTPLEDPAAWVTAEEGQFQVHDRIRERVEFQCHDLIHDDPPGRMDLVLCRNFLIYVHSDYQDAVFETVSSALDPGGILMLGMTESSPPEAAAGFEAYDRPNRIYQKV